MKNLPNVLTLSRIFLTFIFIFLIFKSTLISIILAAVIFTIATLTDYYDGALAKKYKVTSNFGKIMDPIADKFLILAAFFVFAKMNFFSSWIFLLILFREFFITGLRFIAMSKGKILAAEKAGKIKTVAQFTAISVILLFMLFSKTHFSYSWTSDTYIIWDWFLNVMMVVVILLTYYSGISYYWHNREAFRL